MNQGDSWLYIFSKCDESNVNIYPKYFFFQCHFELNAGLDMLYKIHPINLSPFVENGNDPYSSHNLCQIVVLLQKFGFHKLDPIHDD